MQTQNINLLKRFKFSVFARVVCGGKYELNQQPVSRLPSRLVHLWKLLFVFKNRLWENYLSIIFNHKSLFSHVQGLRRGVSADGTAKPPLALLRPILGSLHRSLTFGHNKHRKGEVQRQPAQSPSYECCVRSGRRVFPFSHHHALSATN